MDHTRETVLAAELTEMATALADIATALTVYAYGLDPSHPRPSALPDPDDTAATPTTELASAEMPPPDRVSV